MAEIVAQVRAEGVARVEVVADDPSCHSAAALPGVRVHDRDTLEAVQEALREVSGCTVIVYDQVCATELRRRRKRGLAPQASRRVLINELVCEGCGDCSDASGCVAVEPLETEHGVKRVVNQSACNVDESALRLLPFVCHGRRCSTSPPRACCCNRAERRVADALRPR